MLVILVDIILTRKSASKLDVGYMKSHAVTVDFCFIFLKVLLCNLFCRKSIKSHSKICKSLNISQKWRYSIRNDAGSDECNYQKINFVWPF